MFTGIIEEIGSLRRIRRQGQAMVLGMGAKRILQDIHIGDSIAVNGVCLTVISYDRDSILADVMPETFRKTTLHQLKVGAKLNLERAMLANGRLGGHIVQGHVDCQGIIESRHAEDNAIVFTLKPDNLEILHEVVDQGSIAIDGISLTVVKVLNQAFTVSIIPHTLSQTSLMDKKAGDRVNIECDVLGKYVSKMLLNQRNPATSASKAIKANKAKITAEYLAEHGFM